MHLAADACLGMTDSQALELQSEVFTATGGTTGDGAQNSLGRPQSDRVTLLVREAVQNSWDAKRRDSVVRMHISVSTANQTAVDMLSTRIFAVDTSSLRLHTALLNPNGVRVLTISDFGTVGLGGPTRGDELPQAGEPTNFVDFFRYVGRKPGRLGGGGTYGYGKAAHYLASSVGAICVHTRCSVRGIVTSRFMASALGPEFVSSDSTPRRYTGRHWWGRRSSDGVVDPAVDDDADALAACLGMPARNGTDTGTTVSVLLPILQDGESLTDVMNRVALVIATYFWPKTIDGKDGAPSMCFQLSSEGEPVAIPFDLPVLHEFRRAFSIARGVAATGSADSLYKVELLRPKRLLGNLALTKWFTSQSMGPPERSSLFEGPCRHVALMRAPNFVVRYEPGPPSPYNDAEYCGVFAVAREAEAAFASSEPPTHDDWTPDLLVDATSKSMVRVAKRRIADQTAAVCAPPSSASPAATGPSVAAFSQMMGALIPGAAPKAAQPSSPGSRGRPSATNARNATARISVASSAQLIVHAGRPALEVSFKVPGLPNMRHKVAAVLKVALGDGIESEAPVGAERPRVLEWRQGQACLGTGDECVLPSSDAYYTVVVSAPSDALVSVDLRVESE